MEHAPFNLPEWNGASEQLGPARSRPSVLMQLPTPPKWAQLLTLSSTTLLPSFSILE